MKLLLTLLGLAAFSLVSAHAQCTNCGCAQKCSPTCECPHDKQPEPQ